VNPIAQALLDECCRQSENCKYTALTFNIWLRRLRTFRTASLVLPVIFGSLATAGIVTQHLPAWAAVFTLLATALPLAYRSSKTDKSIAQFTRLAGEFTNLRDRFRQLGDVGIHKEIAVFESEFRVLMGRMEKARKFSETPPEWCFLEARKKEKAGHMRHDYDERPDNKG
jgi:hypothetical protein